MDRVHQALENFHSGYNCCQSVFLAYCDLFGLSQQQGAALSSGFGGGMGGLREKCGAVTAMFLLAGLQLDGYDRADIQSKKKLYDLIKQLDADFTAEFGTSCCAELLKNAKVLVSRNPSERNAAYYRKRPCALFVQRAAEIVERRLLLNAQETSQAD